MNRFWSTIAPFFSYEPCNVFVFCNTSTADVDHYYYPIFVFFANRFWSPAVISVTLKVVEEADGAPLREEDAADRDARLLAEQAARDEAEFRKRSQAVRRDLPRPG